MTGTGAAFSRSPDFPVLAPASRSLLKKHLTPDTWEALKGLETRRGTTLDDCIRSGLAHADSRVGLYAGDEDCYEVFGRLFAPLIEDCHRSLGFSTLRGSIAFGATAQRDGINPPQFAPASPDPEGKYIVSTRVRVCRNLRGYALAPTINRDDMLVVEGKVRRAFERFGGALSGTYRSLQDLDSSEVRSLSREHLIFRDDDRFQSAAGIRRCWPDGRGIFMNASRTLMVWVNEEDHLRVIGMQKNADLAAVFSQLSMAMQWIGADLEFQHSDPYGYISTCPTNLGTGLRASFHIRLPLSGASRQFKRICDQHNFQVRGPYGEQSASRDHLYDISNRRRLGLSELQCLQELIEGTRSLIDLEKLFEAGQPRNSGASPLE